MLVWLNLNLKEYNLTQCFGMFQSLMSKIFSTWINYCYLWLRMLPCSPDCDTIRDCVPAAFKEHYPRTTVILDATEIKVNTPSSLYSQTYSNYKSNNTFKALVGISPACHLMFVSSLYTGLILDTELVEQSGFLHLL